MDKQKLKIAVVMDSLFTGGAEFSTILWVSWLRDQNHEVRLVLLKHKDPEYDTSEYNITIQRLRPGGWFSRYRQLKAMIRTYNPDIVHSVLTVSNFLCRLVRLSGMRFAHIESLVNQPYSVKRMQDAHLKQWKIQMLKIFDYLTHEKGVLHFHANSAAVAHHYQSVLRFPVNKMTIVRRGRPKNPFMEQRSVLRQYYRQCFSVSEEQLLLINVARHEYQKGQDVLLKATSLLTQQGVPLKLIIAGRIGALTPLLQQLITDLQIESHVCLLGHRSDIAQILIASDIFIFPSRYEGLPGALVEACAAGLPVICTDLDSMREVIIPEVNALVFKPENAKELAESVSTLYKHKDLRTSFAKNSLDIFEKNFNIEGIHRSMQSMYQQLLKVS